MTSRTWWKKKEQRMSWFSNLFKKQPKDTKFAPTLNGFLPIYSQFGTNIYASDVVQQALKCIVDEMKKLNPCHVRYVEDDPVPVKGSTVQSVLNEPNQIMTTSEFLEKICWLLLMNYNVFIIPTYYTWTDPTTGAEKDTTRHFIQSIRRRWISLKTQAEGFL